MSEVEQEQTQEQDGPEPEPEATPIQPPDEAEEAEEAESDEVEGQQGEPEEPSLEAQRRAQQAAAKRIYTAKTTYAKKLIEILGPEFEGLLACPRCSFEGLPYGGIAGFIIPHEQVPVTGEMRDDVLESIGEQPAQATLQTKYARRCDDCDGNGVVLTGSRTNRDKAIKCPACKGRGWIPVGDELRVGRSDIEPASQGNGIATFEPEPAGSGEPAPDVDLWGRKVGDPDYGMHPLYVGAR